MAEGVLVLGVGKGTKLLESYLTGSKKYTGTGKLGEETDTLDSTGKVINTIDCSNVTLEDIESVLPRFRGDIMQIPPMYSALHSNGSRLYSLAREGVVVEREARSVHCFDISLVRNEDKYPYFTIDVECGGGFYVRSVIADIANSCNGIAHMTKLVRLKQGIFTIDDCLHESDWNYSNIVEKIRLCSKKAQIDIDDIK